LNSAFTVRKISHGEGVERVFQTYSPVVDSIQVKRRGDVRRAKLYYLRGRTARLPVSRRRFSLAGILSTHVGGCSRLTWLLALSGMNSLVPAFGNLARIRWSGAKAELGLE
jgi:hypothetical protein